MTNLIEKEKMLEKIISSMEKVVVAFSGGVDSALVLKKSIDTLGPENVKPVVVQSELFRKEEFEGAALLADKMGSSITEASIQELSNPRISENGPDSWYHSKKMLYDKLQHEAEKFGTSYVLDGMILDDLKDFRPGLKARTEAKVKSVLQMAKFYKEDVRNLSKQLEIPVWNKPASCSLASRVPYHEEVTTEKVRQIDYAEKYIMNLGFPVVRVRHHGDIARIEVEQEKITSLFYYKNEINQELTKLGFNYIAIDIEGYQSGKMNEMLTNSEKEVNTEKLAN